MVLWYLCSNFDRALVRVVPSFIPALAPSRSFHRSRSLDMNADEFRKAAHAAIEESMASLMKSCGKPRY